LLEKFVEILFSFSVNSDTKAEQGNKSLITLLRKRKDAIHEIDSYVFITHVWPLRNIWTKR